MSTRKLPCELTDAEIRIKAEELARMNNEIPGIIEEKKAMVAGFNERIGDLHARMASLSQEISTHAEIREIRCEERFDWDSNVAETIRMDTEEVIHRRLIHPEERQRKFKIVDAAEKREQQEGS